MTSNLILASGSQIRRQMLESAGVKFTVETARIDEDAIKASLLSEEAKPRDIADSLAEFKARRVAQKQPNALVLGCDQVLDFNGTLLSKPTSKQDALDMLSKMAGKSHKLFSAAVIYEGSKPVWRSVAQTTLMMRNTSVEYLEDYVSRNWNEIRHCVGCYQIEGEGSRLFARIDGDYFTVLGMPLLDVLGYLTLRGYLDG